MKTASEISREIAEARVAGADWETVIQPLYTEQAAIIKRDREAYEDKHYFVAIDCPEHLTHKVPLYTNGHRTAGIWECEVDGISDSCPHFDTETLEDEDNDGHKYLWVACVLCGVDTERTPDYDDGE